MNLVIDPCTSLHGTAKIPPNKSHSFRALIMAGLAEGVSKIHAPAVSNDWMFATEALELFGAEVEPHAGDVWEIRGTGGKLRTPDEVIRCGNSGIILRFFTAMAACGEGYTVLTGDESLRHLRPMGPLVNAINQLGGWAVCTKGDGHAPVVVRGRLRGGRAELDGADSQFVSALLIASCLSDAPTELIVRNPGEKPWVGVTLDWLRRIGADYSHENFERYRIRGQCRWGGFEYTVPSDWSAALYPIVAALLTPDSEVHVPDMDPDDPQGDKRVVDVLREMGGDIEWKNGCLVARSSRLTGRTIDCNDFIDQLPILAVAGTAAEGETTLVNAAICREKECDRIAATCRSLAAMGAKVEEHPDGLTVRKSTLQGTRLNSYQDHRMVMSLTVAALTATGRTILEDCDCVKKTFPRFPEQMVSLGAEIRKE